MQTRDGFFSGYIGHLRHDVSDDVASNILDGVRHHFLSLIGEVVDYYGADAGENEFKIDEIVFKVLEDPSDGYRSMLGAVDYGEQSRGIFFRTPIARVRIEEYDRHESKDQWGGMKEGYRLVDVEDGHKWLEFGTDNVGDYYPIFIFRHWPKAPRGDS